jgi:hypothetical protein
MSLRMSLSKKRNKYLLHNRSLQRTPKGSIHPQDTQCIEYLNKDQSNRNKYQLDKDIGWNRSFPRDNSIPWGKCHPLQIHHPDNTNRQDKQHIV